MSEVTPTYPTPSKKVLVVKDKYDTYYYDVTTREQHQAVALQLVTERWEEGYTYVLEDGAYIADQEILAALTDEQIETFPTETLKDRARDDRKYAQRYVKEAKNHASSVMLAGKAVDTKDGALAWRVLSYRADHEYEYVAIEWLRDAGE